MPRSNWGHYVNGNYKVSIDLSNGTKIKYNKENKFISSTIDNFDYKITSQCDIMCPYCFECATLDGKHGDIMNQKFIDTLHPYTEIAIGGGNPLFHPNLIPFLEKCKRLKLIPSITVNQIHFERQQELIDKLVNEKLIYGLGISLVDPSQKFIEKVQKYSNAVIHIINGVVTEEQLNALMNHNLKILILGYKEVGKGKNLYKYANKTIEDRKFILQSSLNFILKSNVFAAVSFDNRALKQLSVKSLIPKEQWDLYFMGDDGIDGDYTSASMFIDGVKEEFTINSCSPDRYPLMDNIKDMYKFLEKKYGKSSKN